MHSKKSWRESDWAAQISAHIESIEIGISTCISAVSRNQHECREAPKAFGQMLWTEELNGQIERKAWQKRREKQARIVPRVSRVGACMRDAGWGVAHRCFGDGDNQVTISL